MSRYLVDKFMRHVNQDAEALDRYAEDRRGYLAEWLAGERLDFTPEERKALEDGDYEPLYRLGAHPFLLWSFIEAVWSWTGEIPRPQLVKEYKEKTGKIGYPDFIT